MSNFPVMLDRLTVSVLFLQCPAARLPGSFFKSH
jgi:hypothetical protein